MIPHAFNPLGRSRAQIGYIEYTATRRAAIVLAYVSESPLPYYVNDVYAGDMPAQSSYQWHATSTFAVSGDAVRIELPPGTLLYDPSNPSGGGALFAVYPGTIKIRGYSPASLQDLFYSCTVLSAIDIDEAELTKNCSGGWRVFADCSNLVFTPPARYSWDNPAWTGAHSYVFRGCTSMPNYNQIPSSWGGGGQ